MQATGNLHDQVLKRLSVIAVNVSHDVIHLGAPNGMLHTGAHLRDGTILGLLFRRQLTTPRFLLGLIGLDLLRFISLKAGVFPLNVRALTKAKKQLTWKRRCVIILPAKA